MADANDMHIGASTSCSVAEQKDLGHLNLRGNPADADFVDKFRQVAGVSLPLAANTLKQLDDAGEVLRIYWLGPDEWQIVARKSRTRKLLAELISVLGEQHVALNDLSGGYVTVHLSGDGAPRTLARGCSIDLDSPQFDVGCCAQSTLAKANVLLGVIAEGPCFELIVRRSFADYVLTWLRRADSN